MQTPKHAAAAAAAAAARKVTPHCHTPHVPSLSEHESMKVPPSLPGGRVSTPLAARLHVTRHDPDENLDQP
jgi:hypothetical protein